MQVGESPFWHPEQASLYWVDIVGKAVHRFHPQSQQHQQWDLPSEPGCIVPCASTDVLIAMRSGIVILDTEGGALSMIAEAPYDTKKMRFNDGRCDAFGRLWVGTLYEPRDQALGGLFCLERGQIRDTGKRVTVSNGIAFSQDHRTLYHADTTAHRITAYPFDLERGQLGEGRLFHQFSTDKLHNYGGRPDGAAVDSEGAYWCAMFEGGRIVRFSPSGELLREIHLPVRCPTMIAFGGADLRTLYITSACHHRSVTELAQHPLSGCVLSVQVDVAGCIEHAYVV